MATVTASWLEVEIETAGLYLPFRPQCCGIYQISCMRRGTMLRLRLKEL
ncbi:hypothetical protein HanXRQr2_Chr03g0131971 [Helianthus annuus]|uniref:Uncharacterized protein n=1 Tax=Helianthus annuus TaxID=4232 RepID=A0A9K3JKE9_HELAN|nr:hypothetical protein HanXRQr2_Chr03g0131971 [Helianthus annuus]KAJ0769639.1 hypothetical protein HanLR1_Chr03g0114971 [Helianthus annuus]